MCREKGGDEGERKEKVLLVFLDVYTRITAVDVAVVLSNADVLFSPPATRAAALSVFFSDADIFAGVAVVTAGLLVSITSIFPFSALNRDSLVSLDFGGLGSLLVPVG